MSELSVQKAVERVLECLDEEGNPDNMTKREWKELLEEVISSAQSRLECVEQELEEEEEAESEEDE